MNSTCGKYFLALQNSNLILCVCVCGQFCDASEMEILYKLIKIDLAIKI